MLFAPTQTAMRNLRNEGLPEERLGLVGDVMYDASLFYRSMAKKPDWFAALGVVAGEFVLATVHRAENTDDVTRLQEILNGLARTGRPVVLPLHPRTRERLGRVRIDGSRNLHFVDPASYLEMVWLEANCYCVATDSGGVQKEAYFFEKPCITLRNETEWVELVDHGWNTIAGTDGDTIAAAIEKAQAPSTSQKLYGAGDAAAKIVKALV